MKTKPRFIWNERDMLWIVHDEHGKPGFAMNHAQELRAENGIVGFYLMEADRDFRSEVQVDYTRVCRLEPPRTRTRSNPWRGL